MSNFRNPQSSLNRSSFNGEKGESKKVGFEAIKLQLQAQIAQSSYLQSRLNSTMDSLDVLRMRHRREIALEREAKEMLKRKMDELVEYTARVEEERDDLRECVAALIDKVEVANDFSSWPHRHISLLEPLEPIQDISGNQPKSQKQPYRAFEHYPTIIALLRSELEKERASHARTHDTAELEILTLRAQLARREAVLEECLVHSNIPRSTSKAAGVDGGLSPSGHAPASSKPKLATKAQPQANLASRITPEEASQLLRSRAEKNRRLEAEIKEIAVRLEQARAESFPTQASSSETAHSALDTEEMYSSTESQVVVIEDDNDTVVNSVPHEPKTPTSPDLHPIVILDMPSPFAMTPRRPTSPSALAQLAMRNSLKAQDAAQVHPSEHLSSEPSAIQKLEEQVGRLAQEIDAFSVQRGDMLEVIAREQQAQTNTHERGSDRVTNPGDIENSPLVLELRSQMEQVKCDAARREAELLEEIRKLRDNTAHEPGRSVHPTSDSLNIPFIPSEALAQSTAKRRGPLSEYDEEDDGGEKSMDLDTPQTAVSALMYSLSMDSVALPPEHDLDASLIPLPPSPVYDGHDLPPLRMPTIRDRPPTPFLKAQNLEQEDVSIAELVSDDARMRPPSEERLKALETELADAREQVADRDVVLVELQHLINDLRVQMRDAGMKAP